MAFLPRLRVAQPVSPRQPDKDSLLITTQKELWPFFQQVRKVLNWAAKYIGMVQVDASQEPAYAVDALVAGTGVTIAETGTTPNKKLQFSANPSEITTIVNTTIIETAAVTGATLYPAATPDPLLRPGVRALSAIGLGYGLNFTDDCVSIPGLYTWRRINTDPILAYVDGGAGNFAFSVGDRFAVLNAYGAFGAPAKYNGIYELLTQGDGLLQAAVFRRTDDANTSATMGSGTTVQVSGVGVAFAGQYIQFTTATPTLDTTEITYTIPYTYSAPSTTALLTNSQVALASTATADAGAAVTTSSPNDLPLMASGSWVTLARTPGASGIPAGKFSVQQLAYVTVPDFVTPPRINWKLRVVHFDGSADADFLLLFSPPITATVPTLQTFEANLAAPVTISPTDRIEARAYAHATGTTTVDVRLIWNNAARDTRIITTLQVDSGGLGGPVDPDYWQPGWLTDQAGLGVLKSYPESSPSDEGSNAYTGTVTAAEGEKQLAIIHTDHVVPFLWPNGRWSLTFTATAGSLASATYIKATLGTSTTAGAGWAAQTGANAFAAEFLIADTSLASPTAKHTFTLVLPETAAAVSALAIRFTMRTASVGAVTVTVGPGTLLKTSLDARPSFNSYVATTTTVNGVPLSGNVTIDSAATNCVLSGTKTITAGYCLIASDGYEIADGSGLTIEDGGRLEIT